MVFLIIVSAPGPGWPRFGFIRDLGASKKFVGRWVVFLIIVSALGPAPGLVKSQSLGIRLGQCQCQGQGA